MSGREQLTADQPGERLDAFLARRLPQLSRAHVQRLIAADRVRVDDASVKASLRLTPGARVLVEIPPPQPLSLAAEPIPLAVIYEDGDLLVIDKPAGMTVHPGPGHTSATVVNAALAHCPDLAGIDGTIRPGIVHRLDKDTSGLLMIAKNDTAQRSLSAQLAARTVRKEYLSLVCGRPPDHGVIDAPIGRHRSLRKQMAIVAEGRPARTFFRTLGAVGADTLMLARLESGRTHQIRVHFAAAGYPVLGDPVYGTRSELIGRQFLHAWRLGFQHPRSDALLELEAPLPADLHEALQIAQERAGEADPPARIEAMLASA